MPILKLKLSLKNLQNIFSPLVLGGLLSIDTTNITADTTIFTADNYMNSDAASAVTLSGYLAAILAERAEIIESIADAALLLEDLENGE